MPIVRLEILEGRSQEVKQRLAAEITQAVARNLGTQESHVYVIFSDVAKSDWSVGGKFFGSPSTTVPNKS